jgi:NAD(P)-dependent dehydrogenase (short-subunit alcohol dehydrogenase family)
MITVIYMLGARKMTDLAIVTGYSSGLGNAITSELLERRWSVVGVCRRPSDTAAFRRYSGSVQEVCGSVMAEATADAAFEKAASAGGASLVINCAGQGVFGEVGEYSASDIIAAIEGNLGGLMLFSDRAVRHFDRREGIIVNILSTSAKRYRPSESVYAAVKWGAKAYTRTLRDAVKARGLAIRVFEVYPCGMQTGFWKSAIRPLSDGKGFPEAASIADTVVRAVLDTSRAYANEVTFDRS